MIKTIIVDDEIWVIKLIKNLIDWEQMGFCVVGDADNGEDALALVKEKLPQVLITDIRMPGSNGLSLIQQAKEFDPNIQVVIISGYGEFDYAKTALELGVFSYLLKPVDKAELENVLTRIRGEINKDRDQTEILEELRQSQEKQKKTYFEALLFEEDCELKTEEALNGEYAAGFVRSRYAVLVYSLIYPRRYGKENRQIRRSLIKSIYGSADSGFNAICSEVVKLETPDSVVLVLNYLEDMQPAIDSCIDESYARVTTMPFFTTGHTLVIGVSCPVQELSKLKPAYHDAAAAAKARVYQNGAEVIRCPLDYERRTLEEIIPVEIEKRLGRMAEIRDGQEAESLLASVLQPEKPLHPDDLFCAAGFIIGILFQAWRSHEKLLDEYHISREEAERELDNCLSVSEMTEFFIDLVKEVDRLTSDSVKSQQEKIVAQVKAFIHKNYGEKLSLEMICEAVFFSPQYVCTVFKQQEGVTIVDYLTDYRMSVARELLLNKQYYANDVMRMVGYQDAKYFSKVFKKKMGVTPSEYRKMFS